MSEHDIDISDIQCFIFHISLTRLKKSPEACRKIFQDNDVFGFIASCYDILHLSSYECVLDDVEEMLKNRGVSVC